MLAPEQARIALFRTLGRCQEEKAKHDGGATECCMLGSHLNDLSSCLVDEDCTMLDARVGSACGWFSVTFFFSSKTRKNVGTSMCTGWRREVSRILTSRSREGQAKLGGVRAQVESWRGPSSEMQGWDMSPDHPRIDDFVSAQRKARSHLPD